MKLQTSLVSLAAVLASTAIASSAAAQAPFKINELIVNGTGCEKGTFTVRSSARGGEQELTIRFRELEAQGGAVANQQGMRRANVNSASCGIRAAIQPAPGFQIALVDVDLRGRADVQGRRDTDLGVNNVVRIDRRYSLNVPGFPSEFRSTSIVNTDANYTISDDFAFLTYGGCDQEVIAGADLTVAVAGRGNYGSIRVLEEEADGIRLGFRVRRCGDGPDIIPIAASETISNACVLDKGRRTCYDRNGRQISSAAD